MPLRISAEPMSSAALTIIASGAPKILIRPPARPGPSTSAPEVASAFFACASTSLSRATTCVSTICAAVPATVCTVPMTKPIAYSQGMLSQPIHQATGTLMAHTATADSPTTYTGSLRTRSSHTPEGRLSSRKGSSSMAVSRPICVGVALSSTAAVSGSASIIT
jgi:hypothetical protein